MKIVKQVIAIALISSFSLTPIYKAQANPAAIAPAVLCTGTAGLGCILVGTVIIAGATYYIWEYDGGKKVVADAAGQIFQTQEEQTTDHYVTNPQKCYEMEKKYGWKLVEPPVFIGNGLLPWRCRFAGDARFPNYRR